MRLLCSTVAISGTAAVNEGSTYTLNLSSHGATGTITKWTVNWGDGNTQEFTGNPSSVTHVYTDGPNTRNIIAYASNADGRMYANPLTVTVNNVDPTWTSYDTSYTVERGADGTDRLRIRAWGSFSDPGFTSTETFTITIVWGDGLTDTISLAPNSPTSPSTGSFDVNHLYERGGGRATVTVADDDAGQDAFHFVNARINVRPVIDPATFDPNDYQSFVTYLGMLGVVIHRDPGFNPLVDLDTATLTFGKPGRPPGSGAQDFDGVNPHDELPSDGQTDGISRFRITETGFLDDPLSFVLGAPGVLLATLNDPDHTKVYGLDNLGVLPDQLDGVEEILDSKTLGQATKFFVVDNSTDRFYRYTATAAANNNYDLPTGTTNPRGIASSLTGDTIWVIDAAATNQDVRIQGPSGAVKGSLQLESDITSPQGIANHGADLWIVDKDRLQVRRYIGAALLTTGDWSVSANQVFSLHADNTSPSDLATNGVFVWVTDDLNDKVFVYNLLGAYQGSWLLDHVNTDPSGITLNPAGGDDLWVLDRVDKRVYHYESGQLRRSERQGYTDYFKVDETTNPEGIADPVMPCKPPNSRGTDFWFAVPRLIDGTYQHDVFLTSEVDADGTISVRVPLSGGGEELFSQNFSIRPSNNQFYTVVTLPGGPGSPDPVRTVELMATGGVENKGIHVTSNAPITVYGIHRSGTSPDGFAAIPTPQLGTEYIVLGYGNNPVGDTELALVVTENDTDVVITRPGGQTTTLANLSQGNTYQILDSGSQVDVTGTIITSDKPIAVLGGHTFARVESPTGQPGHVVELLPPVTAWGLRHLSMPVFGRTMDTFRVLASRDNTIVKVDGSTVATLQRGQFHPLTLGAGAEIAADKPILVAQFAQSKGFDNPPPFSPLMTLLPAVDQFTTSYVIPGVSQLGQPGIYVNIVAPAAAVGTIKLDGTTIPANEFTDIGISGFMGVTKPLTNFYHRVEGALPFGAVVYRQVSFESSSYGFPAALALPILAPPTIDILSPEENSAFASGSFQLVTGHVEPGSHPVMSVTVNGVPVDVLDDEGNFFTTVQVAPGRNVFTFTATDSIDQTAGAALTLRGVDVGEGIDFSKLKDVTPSLTQLYAKTSFNEDTEVLYADVSVRNDGQYAVRAPLIVAIARLSDPSVAVRDADGVTPDGLPYYDLTDVVAGGTLSPGASTGTISLAFFNPNGVPFTYDLVYRAALNEPPAFTTAPKVEAAIARAYSYDAGATDPNGDTITYSLPVAPTGMTINTSTGLVSWTPATADGGMHTVVIRASDGRGGTADQEYVLLVTSALPNRPPVFTSIPTNEAKANTAYSYTATGRDVDGDVLTFTLTSGPSGMSVNATTGVFTWTPAANQVGTQTATLQLSDGNGGTAVHTFNLCVRPEAGTSAPVIISAPATTNALQGQTWSYTVQALDGEADTLAYAFATSPPAGMTINTVSGRITWDTSQVSTGSYSVTVKVTDGRGWSVTQVLNLSVDLDTPGTIQGTVFNDLNNDGDRDAGEGGLSGWTVFLDQNQNKKLDTGELSSTSAANGTYSFTSLAPGNYRIAIQPQAGWNGTLPTSGAYSVSLTSGQTLTGQDFGNHQPAVTQNRNPNFTSTAPFTASVGVLLRYDARATDPDGDLLTYDLPAKPDGMAIDPATGIITWLPTIAQVGEHVILVRASDGKGGVKVQAFENTTTGARLSGRQSTLRRWSSPRQAPKPSRCGRGGTTFVPRMPRLLSRAAGCST